MEWFKLGCTRLVPTLKRSSSDELSIMKLKSLSIQKMFHHQSGYTLIELAVVIALLGVLAAIIMLWLIPFMNRGQAEASATETVIVQKAMHEYMIDSGLVSVEEQDTPIQLFAGGSGPGKYLETNTGWMYSWDEKGLVVQGDRIS